MEWSVAEPAPRELGAGSGRGAERSLLHAVNAMHRAAPLPTRAQDLARITRSTAPPFSRDYFRRVAGARRVAFFPPPVLAVFFVLRSLSAGLLRANVSRIMVRSASDVLTPFAVASCRSMRSSSASRRTLIRSDRVVIAAMVFGCAHR